MNRTFKLVVIGVMKCYFPSMKNVIKKFSLVALGLGLSAGSVMADAAAEKVLKKARIAATLGNQELNGHLRKDGKKYPIALFLKGKDIQFAYQKKSKWVKFHMRFKDGGAQLFELKNGKTRYFNKKKLGESLLNTDLSYEDMSMTFLYWKNAKVVRQETLKTQKCDVVRLENPGGSGRYDIVYAWIHKKYGSLMQVKGYNKEGRMMKKFAVDKLMKVKGEYTLQRMRVDSFDPKSRKNTGTTYLEFVKPRRKRAL